MLSRALWQGRAGPDTAKTTLENTSNPDQPVPELGMLQRLPVPHWDLKKLKPCDATGRDEARDTQKADDRSSTAGLCEQGISQLVNFPRS